MNARALSLLLPAVLLVLTAGALERTASGALPMQSLAGDLLVATPDMRDPRFARTVIYVMRHDAQGAQGVIVNRPLGDIPLAKLMERYRMDTNGVSGAIRLGTGGPVEPFAVIVLHTADYAGEGTIAVKNGIAVTGDPSILKAMAAGKGPGRTLFVLGYAGWAPRQLEAEMEAGAWIRASADQAILFDDDHATKWERAQARQKIDL